MDFSRYTKQEQLAMQEVFAKRRKALTPVYRSIIVKSADDPNLPKRIRVGKILRTCANRVEQINVINNIVSKTQDKRRLRYKRTERLERILEEYLDRDPNLPKRLIGNIALKELPFSDLFDKHYDHHRLEVFVKKGLKCVHPQCNQTASRLILTVGSGGDMHLDLFTDDLKHMNVDHIHPVSKGGSDELWNKQPMCAYHNSRKSNHIRPY